MDLHTARITLRPPLPSDDAPLVSLFTDPRTMRHLPIFLSQPWDVPLMAARRESRAQDERLGLARNFTVVLRASQSVIGQAGYRSLWLEAPVRRGELGVVLAHAQQGRGLAWDVHLLLLTLGFEELGLDVVEWVTAEGNRGMRALLAKMGCEERARGEEEEGREQWGKVVTYAMEKKDWEGCKAWMTGRVERGAASEGHTSGER